MTDMPTFPIQHFPVSRMHVAPENPRSDEDVDPSVIEDLAANIHEHGLLSPMIGYLHAGEAFITAGGRRFRALRHLDDTATITGAEWPVQIMDRQNAIDAGNAEQLTHVAMSELDELRVYTTPAYANMTDTKLARLTGRSTLYVQQRRAILALPQDHVEAILDRKITVDQGIGLTYAGDPETRERFFERAQRDRTFGAAAMRNYLSNEVKPWSKFPYAKLTTPEAYEEEGGRLQADLFTGDPLVLDPGVLKSIALDEAKRRAREAFPEAAFISEKPDDLWAGQIMTHPGLSEATDEQRARHTALYDEIWRLRLADESKDDETDGFTPEAAAQIEALTAEQSELHKIISARHWPEDLRALLGVYVWLDRHGNNADSEGFEMKPYALPQNLTPLYDGGWMERPAAKGALAPDGAEATPPAETFSNALMLRIEKIKAHAVRMDLIRSPDNVIAHYVAHVTNRLGYTGGFFTTPDMTAMPDPDLGCTPSKAWAEAEALAESVESKPDEVMVLKPADQRRILAHRMLLCLTPRHHLCGTVSAKIIRSFWTPDADFLKAYSRAQLATMAAGLRPGHYDDQKKSALVELVATLGAKSKDWLPIGFY